MLATLVKPVRDNCGHWHRIGEHAARLSAVQRADFDARLLINVAFEDGAHGLVFSDEIDQAPPQSESSSTGLRQSVRGPTPGGSACAS